MTRTRRGGPPATAFSESVAPGSQPVQPSTCSWRQVFRGSSGKPVKRATRTTARSSARPKRRPASLLEGAVTSDAACHIAAWRYRASSGVSGLCMSGPLAVTLSELMCRNPSMTVCLIEVFSISICHLPSAASSRIEPPQDEVGSAGVVACGERRRAIATVLACGQEPEGLAASGPVHSGEQTHAEPSQRPF